MAQMEKHKGSKVKGEERRRQERERLRHWPIFWQNKEEKKKINSQQSDIIKKS